MEPTTVTTTPTVGKKGKPPNVRGQTRNPAESHMPGNKNANDVDTTSPTDMELQGAASWPVAASNKKKCQNIKINGITDKGEAVTAAPNLTRAREILEHVHC